MGSRSCIFWVGPNSSHICPYRREAAGDLTQKVKAICSLKKWGHWRKVLPACADSGGRGQEQGMQREPLEKARNRAPLEPVQRAGSPPLLEVSTRTVL